MNVVFRLVLILALACVTGAHAAPPVAGYSSSATDRDSLRGLAGMAPLNIGGITVGTAGAPGSIYDGYTLTGGDEYDGGLSIYDPVKNPGGRYISRKINQNNLGGSSPRSLYASFDSYIVDPYHSGNNDANRGVPVASWSDIITQTGGVLRVKMRGLIGNETNYTDNGEGNLTGWMGGALFFQAMPPVIIESRVRVVSASTVGGGPAFWSDASFPYSKGNSSEVDFDHLPSVSSFLQVIYHWTQTGSKYSSSFVAFGNSATAPPNMWDGQFHLLTLVIGWASTSWYIDGTLIRTLAYDLTVDGKRPRFIWHSMSAGTGTVNAFVGNDLFEVDYDRFWSSTGHHRAPLTAVPDTFIPFGGTFSITLPDAASTWGDSGVSDFVTQVPYDARTPGDGRNAQFFGNVLSAGVTRVGNVLSGTVTDQPGRMLFTRTGTNDGDTVTPQLIGVNVGPRWLGGTSINMTVGQALSIDSYTMADVGNLGPPIVTWSGLPTGVTYAAFGPASTLGYLSGTPTGTATATVTIANEVGQSIGPISVAFGPATPGSGVAPPTFPNSSFLVGSLDFDKTSSVTLASGSIGAGGSISAIAGSDGTTFAASQATGGAQPTSVTVNNHYAAQFSGAQYLDWSSVMASHASDFGAAFTIVVVGQLTSIPTTSESWIDLGHAAVSATAQRAGLGANVNQQFMYSGGSSTGTALDGGTGAQNVDTAMHCLVGRLGVPTINNGSIATINRDGLPNSANNASSPGILSGSPNPLDEITIGAMLASSTIQRQLKGKIIRVLLYASPNQAWLEDYEVNALHGWCASNYGTQ